MKKPITLFAVVVLSSILLTTFYSFAEEKITLTTYYPAPYGVYREMRANQMAIGSGYRQVGLSDGMFIVNGTVGIGTASPQNKLQIHATTDNDHLLITGTSPGIQFSDLEAGTERAAIGLATTANQYAFGSAANDLVFRTNTDLGNILFGLYASSNQWFPVLNITNSGSLRLDQPGNIPYVYPRIYIKGGTSMDENTEGFIKLETAGGSPTMRLRIGVRGADNPSYAWIQASSSIGGSDLYLQPNTGGNGNTILNLNSGEVGIGTASPDTNMELHVVGDPQADIRVQRAGYDGIDLFSSATAGGLWNKGDRATVFATGAPDGYERMRIDSSGNVGIGTVSPNAPLSFGSSTGDKIYLYDGSNKYGFGIAASLMQIFSGDSTRDIAFGHKESGSFTELMRIKGDGNVGIGINNPGHELDVVGSIYATDFLYGSWGGPSDKRLKKDIYNITNALKKVQQLRGRSFRFKRNNELSIGFIAQEIEGVVPELVKEDNNGYKFLQYGPVTALIVEAVKEQQGQIEELKREVQVLKERLNQAK